MEINNIRQKIDKCMNDILFELQLENNIDNGDTLQVMEWNHLLDETERKWKEMFSSIIEEQKKLKISF